MNNLTPYVVEGDGKTPLSTTIGNLNDISMCIDWFTCTFDFIQMNYRKAPFGSWQEKHFIDGNKKLNRLYELLTFPNSTERFYEENNIAGYKDGNITLGEHIKIWFGGAINKNNLNHNKLDMSGAACQDFIKRGGNFTELFNWLLSNGANFTRVDTAIDVMTYKYFDIKKLYQYTKSYSYVSPMRMWSYLHGGDSSTETSTGETLYIGSESSNTLICIYDKKLEQFNKGIEIISEAWIRVEIRFKRERAIWFVSEFLNNSTFNQDYSFIAAALFAVLDFKEKVNNDSQKYRWPTCKWWLDFLSVAGKADFSSKVKIKPTIERKINWLDHTVSKPLSQIYYYDPDNFVKNLFDLVYKRSNEITNVDLSMINDQRLKVGLGKLSMDDILKQQENLTKILVAFGVDKKDEL